ncbi:MAG: polysaccharide biosynthesis tyrosine autokinase [Actinomycetota bacterium]|nr:polysaccharide biosynthesis tyrosine autokinase [Actinomycetota bacterium]
MNSGPLELRDYLSILWSRKKILMAVVTTTTIVALVYSFWQAPTYVSSSEVVVRAARLDPGQPAAATGFLNMDTEQQVANSLPVAQLAGDRLTEKGVIPAATSATKTQDAETITFTSVGPDPASTQATADAYAAAYLGLRRESLLKDLELARNPYVSRLSQIRRLMREISHTLSTTKDGSVRSALNSRYLGLLQERSDLTQQLNELATPDNVHAGEVLQSAAFPVSPASPNPVKNGTLGVIVGLALGLAAAFFRDRVDDRVRGRAELELHSGAPVLAFVPRIPSQLSNQRSKPIVLSEPYSDGSEAYNALRVRLLYIAKQRNLKTLVVTSSLPGEGKSSTVANLGVSLALTGKRVVMVSADLRQPSLHQYFRGLGERGLKGGLTEVLRGYLAPPEALSPTSDPNLWIVDIGSRIDSEAPTALLGSDRMRDLLSFLSDFADFVLIDTPPLLTSSDVLAVAPQTDGALFVVDPRLVERPVVEQARHELQLSGTPVIGVVVNRYDPRWFQAYGSGYDYVQDGQPDTHDRASQVALQSVTDDIEG